jgi:hypothetical protein
MASRTMELFRRGRLLVLSGALAIGSLAAVAGTAHAQNPPQLSVTPANSASCPVLTFTGTNFTNNSEVYLHLYRNGSYVTTFYLQSNGSGGITLNYNNHLIGPGAWSAYADDTAAHLQAWSNHTATCSK